jgi:23S rRNA pseudouridine955/2504/2580 synthase
MAYERLKVPSMSRGGVPTSNNDPERAKVRYREADVGDVGQRIDNFLMRELRDVPRSLVYRILRSGEVRVNGGRVQPSYRLALNDRVRIPPVRTEPVAATVRGPSVGLQQRIAQAVLYEDRELLAIDKPAGVAVHGGSGISFGVIEALRAARPELTELELVHRLDRDTSGCLLLAKRRAALRELHALLRERAVEKTYATLVCGHWALGNQTIDLPLKTNLKQGGERVVRVHSEGLPAQSSFVVKQHFAKLASLLEVRIGTGRTHQIRVHAAYAGHPIAGDEKYGDRDRDAKLRAFGLQRMFLHAQRLQFQRNGVGVSIAAPLPAELQQVLERLAAHRAWSPTDC